MQIKISLSALVPSQYRPYVKGWDKSRYEEMFRPYTNDAKAYRIFLPLENVDKPEKPVHVRIPTALTRELKQLGYIVEDYVKGIARKANAEKRIFKIGRVLEAAGLSDLKKAFDNDPHRKQARAGDNTNLLVCISRHPYDIAGMSTNRGWRSCMTLDSKPNVEDGGMHKKYVMHDVKEGSIIAYLIDGNDMNITHPKGRVLIKPFINTQDPKDFILVSENEVYGEVKGSIVLRMKTTVNNWLAAVNGPAKTAIYDLNEKLYQDDIPARVATLDTKMTDFSTLRSETCELAMEDNPPPEYVAFCQLHYGSGFIAKADEKMVEASCLNFAMATKVIPFTKQNYMSMYALADNLGMSYDEVLLAVLLQMKKTPDIAADIIATLFNGNNNALLLKLHVDYLSFFDIKYLYTVFDTAIKLNPMVLLDSMENLTRRIRSSAVNPMFKKLMSMDGQKALVNAINNNLGVYSEDFCLTPSEWAGTEDPEERRTPARTALRKLISEGFLSVQKLYQVFDDIKDQNKKMFFGLYLLQYVEGDYRAEGRAMIYVTSKVPKLTGCLVRLDVKNFCRGLWGALDSTNIAPPDAMLEELFSNSEFADRFVNADFDPRLKLHLGAVQFLIKHYIDKGINNPNFIRVMQHYFIILCGMESVDSRILALFKKLLAILSTSSVDLPPPKLASDFTLNRMYISLIKTAMKKHSNALLNAVIGSVRESHNNALEKEIAGLRKLML